MTTNLSDANGMDSREIDMALHNMNLEKKRREGFRRFLENRDDYTRCWVDSYGNRYEYRYIVAPFTAEFSNARTGRHRARIFKTRKAAKNWTYRIYQKKESQFKVASEAKALRNKAREMEKELNKPTKSQVLQSKITNADVHLKELARKVRRLQTAVKHWHRVRAGLQVARIKIA